MFSIVGGHPALDLANTVEPRLPGRVERDHLSDPAALVRWARRAGVLGEDEPAEPTAAALADVLALRALIDPVLAGDRLDVLLRRWATAVERSRLIPGPHGSARLEIGTDPAMVIGDRLADALVDLVRNADLSRLRACPPADGGCGWLFLDRSRNNSRRWCSMDDCGTHAKSRRLTDRRRARR
jgi:predicted RNA-binding Zn ribbon-like protein